MSTWTMRSTKPLTLDSSSPSLVCRVSMDTLLLFLRPPDVVPKWYRSSSRKTAVYTNYYYANVADDTSRNRIIVFYIPC